MPEVTQLVTAERRPPSGRKSWLSRRVLQGAARRWPSPVLCPWPRWNFRSKLPPLTLPRADGARGCPPTIGSFLVTRGPDVTAPPRLAVPRGAVRTSGPSRPPPPQRGATSPRCAGGGPRRAVAILSLRARPLERWDEGPATPLRRAGTGEPEAVPGRSTPSGLACQGFGGSSRPRVLSQSAALTGGSASVK